MVTPDPSRPGTVQSMLSGTEIDKIEDVYTKYMKLQKQLEFLEVQEEYIKGMLVYICGCHVVLCALLSITELGSTVIPAASKEVKFQILRFDF